MKITCRTPQLCLLAAGVNHPESGVQPMRSFKLVKRALFQNAFESPAWGHLNFYDFHIEALIEVPAR